MAKAKIKTSEVSREVYTKIAVWHNGEKESPDTQNLKLLANEIVEFILEEAFKKDGVSTDVGIEMGPDGMKNMMDEFTKEQQKSEKSEKKKKKKKKKK